MTMYEWIKTLHVISVISWMAALLYLPRLFVYHCQADTGSELSQTLKVMERRLLKAIMTPAMVASWVFGLWLIFGYIGFDAGGWLHAKLAAAIGLTAFHGFCVKWWKAFACDENANPQKFYRFMNEVPTLLMVAIVVLVIVRPF